MKAIIVSIGLAVGLYLGLYICFIGGIVDIVNELKSDDISGMGLAWGVVKIVFASFIGWASFAATVSLLALITGAER